MISWTGLPWNAWECEKNEISDKLINYFICLKKILRDFIIFVALNSNNCIVFGQRDEKVKIAKCNSFLLKSIGNTNFLQSRYF